MPHQLSTLPATKRIALIAHDNRKVDLLEWARFNRETLSNHRLFATGTTGRRVNLELGLEVHRFQSGPLGGDQQVGAKIAEKEIDMVIFFWDPLQPLPHDVDVKALLRLAVVYNIPTACNRATADFLISSELMAAAYDRRLVDYADRGSASEPRLEQDRAPLPTEAQAGFVLTGEPASSEDVWSDPSPLPDARSHERIEGRWG